MKRLPELGIVFLFLLLSISFASAASVTQVFCPPNGANNLVCNNVDDGLMYNMYLTTGSDAPQPAYNSNAQNQQLTPGEPFYIVFERTSGTFDNGYRFIVDGSITHPIRKYPIGGTQFTSTVMGPISASPVPGTHSVSFEVMGPLGGGDYYEDLYGSLKYTISGSGTNGQSNTPPTVNAGPNQTIFLPVNSVSLSGSASDDGKISPLAYTWSKVSGPGAVSFGNPNSASTSATFTGMSSSPAGSYILRLSAYDGAYTSDDTIKIDVYSRTSTNLPPSISITSPRNNEQYSNAPTTVYITALATDSDGVVSKVEFFQGNTKVGDGVEGSNSAWTVAWNGVAAGTYNTLTAKATDNFGAVTTSDPINITVNSQQSSGPGITNVQWQDSGGNPISNNAQRAINSNVILFGNTQNIPNGTEVTIAVFKNVPGGNPQLVRTITGTRASNNVVKTGVMILKDAVNDTNRPDASVGDTVFFTMAYSNEESQSGNVVLTGNGGGGNGVNENTCQNHLQDPGETGVDCGAICGTTCPDTQYDVCTATGCSNGQMTVKCPNKPDVIIQCSAPSTALPFFGALQVFTTLIVIGLVYWLIVSVKKKR